MVAKGGGCGDAGGGYSERRGEAEMRTHDKEGRKDGRRGWWWGCALRLHHAAVAGGEPASHDDESATRYKRNKCGCRVEREAVKRARQHAVDGEVGSRMWHTLRRTGSAPSAEEAAKEAQRRARPLANGCSCSWRWRNCCGGGRL